MSVQTKFSLYFKVMPLHKTLRLRKAPALDHTVFCPGDERLQRSRRDLPGGEREPVFRRAEPSLYIPPHRC
ncbi:MAG: hypothetical protein N3B10_13120 [Armatimonadetes bacterium]|nr:hypothetical protein [Armatimonadota bacterium]